MTDEIRTERLLLRRWREEDREPFAAMNADPRVMEHFVAPLTRERCDAVIVMLEAELEECGYGFWALEHDGEFIGFTGLHRLTFESDFTPAVEVGWRLVHHAWGHGYATEAARAALARGFEEVDSIVAMTALGNTRSRRVMERLGMTEEHEFEHPNIPATSPVRRHVLYRLHSARAEPPSKGDSRT